MDHELRVEVGPFPLEATLDCGQVFCWQKGPDGWWNGWISDERVRLREESPGVLRVFHEGKLTEQNVRDYFAAYPGVEDDARQWAQRDEFFAAALDSVGVIRVLRQPAWECLASFICSSQKQVAQIQAINRALRTLFGEQGRFPKAERLAIHSPLELRRAQLGYRARHLAGAARHVAEHRDWFEQLPTLATEKLLCELQKLPGVGRKVAHCVALFGYARLDCFPVDVWVKRILEKLYFPRLRKKMTEEECYLFGPRYFGPHCGIAQQIMFHWLRKMSAQNRGMLFSRAARVKIPRAQIVLQKIRNERGTSRGRPPLRVRKQLTRTTSKPRDDSPR